MRSRTIFNKYITTGALIAGCLSITAQELDNSGTSKFYAADIKSAMHEHLEQQIESDGFFYITDEKTGEKLKLKFLRVHDPVRQITGNVYFACTDFHVEGKPKKIYDLDFWLEVSGDSLRVYDTKIHKEPRSSLLYGWYKHPRYTFVNDKIEYLY